MPDRTPCCNIRDIPGHCQDHERWVIASVKGEHNNGGEFSKRLTSHHPSLSLIGIFYVITWFLTISLTTQHQGITASLITSYTLKGKVYFTRKMQKTLKMLTFTTFVVTCRLNEDLNFPSPHLRVSFISSILFSFPPNYLCSLWYSFICYIISSDFFSSDISSG